MPREGRRGGVSTKSYFYISSSDIGYFINESETPQDSEIIDLIDEAE
jgi:hypothetical protein